MIACGTYLSLLYYGRMTNIAEMLSSTLGLKLQEGFWWKFVFFAGYVFLPILIYYIFGPTIILRGYPVKLFDTDVVLSGNLSIVGWIISGLLVGLGTRMCGGC